MESSVRVDGKWAWDGEGWAGSGIWSSKNGIKEEQGLEFWYGVAWSVTK